MHTSMYAMNTEMVRIGLLQLLLMRCDIRNLTTFIFPDLTRLGVWVLDGDPGHSNLLKFALNANNYEHTLIILTVSMTTPWFWQEQLQHWIKVLSEHVDKLNIDSGKFFLRQNRTN